MDRRWEKEDERGRKKMEETRAIERIFMEIYVDLCIGTCRQIDGRNERERERKEN